MQFSGFDWDDGNRTKCQKHGVSVDTVERVFNRGVMILPDDAHSLTEQRFRGVGYSAQGRALFVVFTIRRPRGEVLIRPISARFMHKKEVEHYEKTDRA
jgi:uncharacterized DUF497 family protein